jgi:dihydrofolate reductase
MSQVTCQITMSLDGYVAGPNPTREEPLGEGGERVHEWAYPTGPAGQHDVDAEVAGKMMDGIGAFIMGRKMFDGSHGPLDESWRGWWGENPPYHAPVYVLTHHPREPVEMEGGTTFHFVTDGIESALEQARAAAGGQDVAIAGGAQAVQQYLAAGLLDEIHLHIAPMMLGDGTRLFENAGFPTLEPVEVVPSPAVTHVRYRVVR